MPRLTASKWFSWTGIVFAALYLAVAILCIAGALSADGDDKGRFILLQLPLALQLALLHDLNLDRLLDDLSWTGGYLLIGLPTLASSISWAGAWRNWCARPSGPSRRNGRPRRSQHEKNRPAAGFLSNHDAPQAGPVHSVTNSR